MQRMKLLYCFPENGPSNKFLLLFLGWNIVSKGIGKLMTYAERMHRFGEGGEGKIKGQPPTGTTGLSGKRWFLCHVFCWHVKFLHNICPIQGYIFSYLCKLTCAYIQKEKQVTYAWLQMPGVTSDVTLPEGNERKGKALCKLYEFYYIWRRASIDTDS